MKIRLVAFTLAALFCADANAQTAEDIQICGQYGSFAETINMARNTGTPMSVMLQSARTAAADNDVLFEIWASIIRDVYDRPLYRTEEMRQQQSADIRNAVEADCFSILMASPE